jgi:RNA polymerase-binding transcription factor DksA
MAKTPEHQQRTDAERIGFSDTGRLDATAPASAPRRRARQGGRRPSTEQIRERLLTERRAAVEELARLALAHERDTASGTGESPFEEHRQRAAERINRLTRALERLAHGEYGACEECGAAIEPARLAAVPEVAACRECQERRERGERAA